MGMTATNSLSGDELKRACDLMKVLSHPTRLRLAVHLLAGESSVADMERILDIHQPNLSQHLGELREASSLVSTRREQKLVFYTLTDPAAINLLEAMPAILGGEKLWQSRRQASEPQIRHGGAAVFAVVGDVP
jgi:DNA-binding transcriptional ArsR family regulator